tara:strand:- start:2459 stop:2857 length:399 start_codon:yes stop_codon:yes gene_type:complete
MAATGNMASSTYFGGRLSNVSTTPPKTLTEELTNSDVQFIQDYMAKYLLDEGIQLVHFELTMEVSEPVKICYSIVSDNDSGETWVRDEHEFKIPDIKNSRVLSVAITKKNYVWLDSGLVQLDYEGFLQSSNL